MFGMGHWELVIIGIVAILLFGSRLPVVARSFGQSIWEFKKGLALGEVGVDDIKQQATKLQQSIKEDLAKEVT